MKVIKAKQAGACYGVKRALDMANKVISSNIEASTLGSLIHNPQVVDDLQRRGLNVAKDIDDIKCGTVIIRSHGVTPQTLTELKRRGLNIVDATCPHVARAQLGASELAKAGCRVLVVGESGHPEVEGLYEYALQEGCAVDVVCDPEDIPDDLYAPIGVVVQTTQKKEALDRIVDALRKRGIEPIIKDTICSATSLRQASASKLSSEADAMVVIGGKNSSNTTRLAEICRENCPSTYHIESSCELNGIDFSNCAVVGVTAGASTPEEQIDDVISYLERI